MHNTEPSMLLFTAGFSKSEIGVVNSSCRIQQCETGRRHSCYVGPTSFEEFFQEKANLVMISLHIILAGYNDRLDKLLCESSAPRLHM